MTTVLGSRVLVGCAMCSVAVIVALLGCSKTTAGPTGPGAPDAEADAGTDAGPDVGTDAGGIDGGVVADGGGIVAIDAGPFAWGTARVVSTGGVSYVETEPHIAADGDGGVVAAWIAGRGASPTTVIGYAISRDDGVTWGTPLFIESPGGRKSADPVVAADRQGRFFVAWLGYRPGTNDSHIYAATLAPGATAFGAAVPASDDGTATTLRLDKPWVVVDQSDRALITWKDDLANSLNLAVSQDAGASYSQSTIASGVNGSLAYPCLDGTAGAGTPLYVVFFHDGSSSIRICKSPDTGATWPGSACSVVVAADAEWQDPVCVARGANVWVTYAAGTSGQRSTAQTTPGSSVKVGRSANAGETFEPAVTVSDGPVDTQYILPQIAVLPGGELDIIYYSGKTGQAASLVLARSLNGGATWSNTNAAATGTFALTRASFQFLGDYVGLVAAGRKLYAAYSDNSADGGYNHIKVMSGAPQ